jgi:F-type H+-transporting ATPase subunit epsilon
MAEAAMVVEVVTPEQAILSGAAEAVMLRSSDGELTILPGHTPLVTDVVPGLVRVDQGGGNLVRMAVHGGYLHVDTAAAALAEARAATGDGRAGAGAGAGTAEAEAGGGTRVRLLAGVAERAEDIDVARAEQARSEAEARVNELRSARGLEGRDSREPGETREGREREGVQLDPELVEAEDALSRAEVRLQVAQVEGS